MGGTSGKFSYYAYYDERHGDGWRLRVSAPPEDALRRALWPSSEPPKRGVRVVEQVRRWSDELGYGGHDADGPGEEDEDEEA